MKIWHLLKKPVWELSLIFFVFALIYPFIGKLHGGFWLQLASHALVTAILILLTTSAILVKNAEIIDVLAQAREQHKIKPDGPLDVLFQSSIVNGIERIAALKAKEGLGGVDNSELNMLVKACFMQRFALYLAVDSHCPSDYYKLYPQFLDDHKVGLKHGATSWRILAVERNVLEQDYQNNRALFESFVKWHTDNGVLLGQINPGTAKQYAEIQQLNSTDMGLWDNGCSLIFFPQTNTEPLRVRYLAPDHRLFNGCKLYFKSVAAEDSVIHLGATSISFETRDPKQRVDALRGV